MANEDDEAARRDGVEAREASAPRKKKRKKKTASAAARPAGPVEPLPAWSTPKRALLLAGVSACTGIALVGLGPSDLGAALTLAGLLGLVWGVHTLGRAGLA